MGIHEFICRATKGEAVCLLTYDVSKNLDEKIRDLERGNIQKKAMQNDLILCYNS